jgi:hypothetical protein
MISCETCRFGEVVFRKGEPFQHEWSDKISPREHSHILCRKNPPVFVLDQGCHFPPVNELDWCGRYQANEEQESRETDAYIASMRGAI